MRHRSTAPAPRDARPAAVPASPAMPTAAVMPAAAVVSAAVAPAVTAVARRLGEARRHRQRRQHHRRRPDRPHQPNRDLSHDRPPFVVKPSHGFNAGRRREFLRRHRPFRFGQIDACGISPGGRFPPRRRVFSPLPGCHGFADEPVSRRPSRTGSEAGTRGTRRFPTRGSAPLDPQVHQRVRIRVEHDRRGGRIDADRPRLRLPREEETLDAQPLATLDADPDLQRQVVRGAGRPLRVQLDDDGLLLRIVAPRPPDDRRARPAEPPDEEPRELLTRRLLHRRRKSSVEAPPSRCRR